MWFQAEYRVDPLRTSLDWVTMVTYQAPPTRGPIRGGSRGITKEESDTACSALMSHVMVFCSLITFLKISIKIIIIFNYTAPP